MSFEYDKSLSKISLDSAADLKYLSINFAKTIEEKLQKHMPKNVSNNSKDILREKVENLLENFITRTFELAKPNIIINGIEAQETIIEDSSTILEPFNYDLNNKLQSLHNEIEETILKTTQLRREIPRKIFEYKNSQNIAEIKINFPEEPLMKTIKTEHIIEPELPRENEIKQEYSDAISAMKQLKTSIPTTCAKLEKSIEIIKHFYEN
ncbi:hypothetical protein PNEG_00229 [Pneumocystis murina B123]|uniref:Kinetochore protein Mis14 n=1 Tax=Pneumocystis murina (strain B123) TaxID=1069680 RepID=M7NST2_PNEMU|nr:hypothetical protein PNEG_00229 [Pneumocystis murina B123]EMR11803.1 hypothetical protein PNEG_00229 [Pneumocystis murina B123]